MTHDVTVSAAECGKCNGDIAQWTTREKESWVHMVHFEHLKAQKDALWQAAVAAFGPEPIKAILARKAEHICPGESEEAVGCYAVEEMQDALRAQLEAKK